MTHELLRALAALAEPPDAAAGATARLASALDLGAPPSPDEYTELFVFQLYPYASVYLGPEGMLGGEARDRIAGFWRALSLTPPEEVDHLSTTLALYAQLCASEASETDARRREAWQRARQTFLWENVLSWLPAYLHKLIQLAPESFYARWGELLGQVLREEAADCAPPGDAAMRLRDAGRLSDPREEIDGGEKKLEGFLSSLLAPARSGMILTRTDLARAVVRLGLGGRAGERRFVLRSLLGQDAPGVLEWLGAEAAGWERFHRAQTAWLGSVATAWEDKARTSAVLLAELAGEARGRV